MSAYTIVRSASFVETALPGARPVPESCAQAVPAIVVGRGLRWGKGP